MHYVYILKLSNRQYYVGSTPDLKRRLAEHRQGKSESTKDHRPIRLIWCCAFPSKAKAIRFERYLKSGSGMSFRNKRLI